MKNENIEIIKADVALAITKENRASMQECMQLIKANSKAGSSFIIMHKEVDENVINKLMDLGYQIGAITDSFGLRNLKISWKI